MRLSLLGIAWAGIVSLASLASAQQAHLMVDPHPTPLSRAEIRQLRVWVAESAPDMVNASALKVAAAIAARGNPPDLRTPFRYASGQWWFTTNIEEGWRVYPHCDWIEWSPRRIMPR